MGAEKTIDKNRQKLERVNTGILETVRDTSQLMDQLVNDNQMPDLIYQDVLAKGIKWGKSKEDAEKDAKKAKEDVELFKDFIGKVNKDLHTRPDDKTLDKRRSEVFDEAFKETEKLTDAEKDKLKKEQELKAAAEQLESKASEAAVAFISNTGELSKELSAATSEAELNRLALALRGNLLTYEANLIDIVDYYEFINGNKKGWTSPPEAEDTLLQLREQIKIAKQLAKDLEASPKKSKLESILQKQLADVTELTLRQKAKIEGNRPVAQAEINNIVLDRTAALWEEFQGKNFNAIRDKAISFLNDTNKVVRQDPEIAAAIKALDELGHFGTIMGGVTGPSRVFGSIAEELERTGRRIGDRSIVGATNSKLLKRAVAREASSAEMNLGKHITRAFEGGLGRNSKEITLDIAREFLKSIPESKRKDKKALAAYANTVVSGIVRLRAESKVASIVHSLIESGLLATTGNLDGDNKRMSMIRARLHPNTVTYSMMEDLNDYVAKMAWAQDYMEKNGKNLNQIKDNVSRLIINFKKDGGVSEFRYLQIWKLINMAWIETNITSIETRKVLSAHITNARTLLDAEAVGRMLMEQYLRNVKTSAFNLSDKEVKFLGKFKDKNRTQMEFLNDDELWYEILKKIEKKIAEQEMEKNKSNPAPHLVMPTESGAA